MFKKFGAQNLPVAVFGDNLYDIGEIKKKIKRECMQTFE